MAIIILSLLLLSAISLLIFQTINVIMLSKWISRTKKFLESDESIQRKYYEFRLNDEDETISQHNFDTTKGEK